MLTQRGRVIIVTKIYINVLRVLSGRWSKTICLQGDSIEESQFKVVVGDSIKESQFKVVVGSDSFSGSSRGVSKIEGQDRRLL